MVAGGILTRQSWCSRESLCARDYRWRSIRLPWSLMRAKGEHVMLAMEFFLGRERQKTLLYARKGGAFTTTYQENRSRALREPVFLMDQNVSQSALEAGEDK